MLRRVALVRTDVSEERCASIIRVTRLSELGATLAITSNRHTLRRSIKHYLVSITTITKHYLVLAYLVFLRSVRRLIFMANVVPSLPILVILMMEG
jgi:hypothetical protein